MILLFSSYIADLLFGDPEGFPHPVRFMGKIISFLDEKLAENGGRYYQRIKGLITAFIVIGTSVFCACLLLNLSYRLNSLLGKLTWIYLAYTTLSIKDLRLKAAAILKELKSENIIAARKELSKIVTRDTYSLNKEKIITAAVESVAENTNDGIVAPLFYLILGGPILAIAYKSINTLDSMIGYKDKRYKNFGWFSAKLDDIVNFIPARIAGFLISIAAVLTGRNVINSFKIMLRDGDKHPSPNSGIPEAAMAGALGIRLGGIWSYQGNLSVKAFIGDEKNMINYSCIDNAVNIAYITSILMICGGSAIRWII